MRENDFSTARALPDVAGCPLPQAGEVRTVIAADQGTTVTGSVAAVIDGRHRPAHVIRRSGATRFPASRVRSQASR